MDIKKVNNAKDLFQFVSGLSRDLSHAEKGFKVVFEEKDGLQYACYLDFNRNVDKKFYSDSGKFLFEAPKRKGVAAVTYFYKYKGIRCSVKNIYRIGVDGEIHEVECKEIVDKDNYRIDFFNLGSKTTFIVFGGSASTKQTPPFGLSFLLSRGYNVVACRQGKGTQYQYLSYSDFKYYVEPIVDGHDVYCYGSSLGGYCAIYYAGAINANVISAAPRNSAHPEVIKSKKGEKHYNPENYFHGDIKDSPVSDKKVFIFVDPFIDKDMFFLNSFVLPAYPKSKVFHFKHATHLVLEHLNATKQLSSIIDDIVKGRPVVADFDAESACTFIGKGDYYSGKKQYSTARDLYLKAGKIANKKYFVDKIGNRILNLDKKELKDEKGSAQKYYVGGGWMLLRSLKKKVFLL